MIINHFLNPRVSISINSLNSHSYNIDGIELIRQFNSEKILTKTPKMLYSGLLTEELSGLLEKYKQKEIAKDNILNRIKTLINTDILRFCNREDYDKNIISILNRQNYKFDFLLIQELIKVPDVKLSARFVNSKFSDKTFREIVGLIESDADIEEEFMHLVISNTLACIAEEV